MPLPTPATAQDIQRGLAPPGAGLPAGERAVVRIVFALRRWMGTRRSFDTRFAVERERIRSLVRNCDPETGGRRVLIRRITGLEDSSRCWSVWMTLEHLRIVHELIATLIDSLVRGEAPAGTASTAAVKPRPDVGPEVVSEFESSCDAVQAIVAASPDLRTRTRFRHPWFGPLDASGWHALTGMHMGVHRAQIERIATAVRSSTRG